MSNILKVSQLTKVFNPTTLPIEAVKEVDLEVDEGKIIVITGRSGSGKSTLLHLLAGLEQKTSGTILFKDSNYDELTSSQITELRRTEMGFVYQFHYLLNEMTAIENVSLPLLLNNFDRETAIRLSREILNSLGLSHRYSHKPSELSGGEKQRVAIARSMVHSPSLVILDEPTGDLDSATSKEVIDSLNNYVKDKKASLLIATHDENFTKISDQNLIIDSGII
tara:strand:- start:357 stop:1025 length:669 start_codon:yes stop_codon:yes gene_type:complete